MELERTADGSYTLYVPELDEHYHSVKGALTESRHIFIETGLKHSLAPAPRILEIGLGTGLNALLSLITAEAIQKKIHYTGIERFPLSEETLRKLDYPGIIGRQYENSYYAIHRAAWEEDVPLSPWFTLHKIKGDFTRLFDPHADAHEATCPEKETDRHPELPGSSYDLVYFDAFAPEKQPEMWKQTLFDHLYKVLVPGGILTTYCAKGVVRRMLQAAGFTVERLPGPPRGKREILRATKTTAK